eukprot:168411_1
MTIYCTHILFIIFICIFFVFLYSLFCAYDIFCVLWVVYDTFYMVLFNFNPFSTHFNKHMANTCLYVIGNNRNGECGVNHRHNITNLTCWNNIKGNNSIITHINNGYNHTIFIDENNKIMVTGRNANGQCGIAHRNEFFLKCQPINYFNINNLKLHKICTSVAHNDNTYWITKEHLLYGNGYNYDYQLGLGNKNQITAPMKITGLQNIIHVTGGRFHSLCLSGSWFINTDRMRMIIENWIKQCTHSHTAHITMDIIVIISEYYKMENKVYSTGNCVDFCQDGHGSNVVNRETWNIIKTLSDKCIIQIRCGAYHSLFLSKNGIVFGVGCTDEGQLGLNTNITCRNIEKIGFFVTHKIFVVDIQCGQNHNLCIDKNGNVYSWGCNIFGQCGTGSKTNVYLPGKINVLSKFNVVAIKCGGNHSYCKTDDGNHYLFGSNAYNECSLDRTNENNIETPFYINYVFDTITNGKVIKDVFLGYNNTFIVAEQGNLLI